MKPTSWLTPILLTSSMVISPWGHTKEEFISSLEYKVTPPSGDYYGTVKGETAYKNWRRGAFDKERMVEVEPKELPSNLPPPAVIPFAESMLSEVSGGEFSNPALTGEDKVFLQISRDEQKARCVLLGQRCEAFLKPDDTDSVYARPIELQKKNRKIITPDEK
ncbi:hypothetical protein [Neptuniibacter pectenicola]|jgi:hypothetical protein|uniref:hypothetical protein n=1 Tax=Neptuniibacter pectenicola TaxID=1806669 RepID=UPI0008297FA5|nr:hypothetical protein [Neptuniibacter pectenicola]